MRTEGGETPDSPFLAMGMTPENGWISRWSDYNEDPELYFLALGSRTHPISPSAWGQLGLPAVRIEGYAVIGGPEPIFIAQAPAGYFDYRGKRDVHGYDFWVNSVDAQLANHAFCVRNSNRFKTYSGLIWATNASDEPDGYGAQADSDEEVDGTVSPTGEIASIGFIPTIGIPGLKALYAEYKDKIWGRFGFSDAFNVDQNWYDTDALGIDLGMAVVSLENYRTGLIWRLMDGTPAAEVGMTRAGFHETHEPDPRPLLVMAAYAGI
jgi:hypothetical protein